MSQLYVKNCIDSALKSLNNTYLRRPRISIVAIYEALSLSTCIKYRVFVLN